MVLLGSSGIVLYSRACSKRIVLAPEAAEQELDWSQQEWKQDQAVNKDTWLGWPSTVSRGWPSPFEQERGQEQEKELAKEQEKEQE